MEKDDDNSLIPSKLSFEDLKQVNQHGIEYWSARSLQPCLGYSQWRRFENAIQKAIDSCKQSGNDPSHHFAGAGKPILQSVTFCNRLYVDEYCAIFYAQHCTVKCTAALRVTPPSQKLFF